MAGLWVMHVGGDGCHGAGWEAMFTAGLGAPGLRVIKRGVDADLLGFYCFSGLFCLYGFQVVRLSLT